MILIINCRADRKFWDSIGNAIDRSPSTMLAFTKRRKPDRVHELHHHIDPGIVDEYRQTIGFIFVTRDV
jgi:hypothetical protein